MLHGLQQGNAVLKDLQKSMSLSSVEKLMEETAEAQAAQREIDDLLASRMTEEEEEEVLRELAGLEREQLGLAPEPEQTAKEGEEEKSKLDALPHAPTTEPVPEESVEEQLREATASSSERQQQPQRERERQAILA